MGNTKAKIGYNTIFYIHDDNSPGAYISVGQVTNVTPPKISRDAVDATHSQSPDGWREFIAGLKDGGEVSVEILFDPTSAGNTLALAQLDQDQPSQIKISLPQGYDWTADAILTGYEPTDPLDDKQMATVTFKVTGKPTLALAS